jgi:hypothetical protein
MEQLMNKIDKYLAITDKNDAISLSLKEDGELKDIVEIVRKSSDREKIISIFNSEIQEQIRKLIEGGIL